MSTTFFNVISEGYKTTVYLSQYQKKNSVTKIIRSKLLYENELKCYQHLHSFGSETNKDKLIKIPKLYDYGSKKEKDICYFLTLERLGTSVDAIFDRYTNGFTKDLFYWFASRSLHLIFQLHFQNVIHGDIKPDNFVQHMQDLYIVDFGSSSLIHKNSGYRAKRGTLRYASRRQHASIANEEVSRKHLFLDDLESFLYMMMYMYYGTLPWISYETYERSTVNKNMYFSKTTEMVKLVQGMGPLWIFFLSHLETSYEETGGTFNYTIFIRLFSEMVSKDFVPYF